MKQRYNRGMENIQPSPEFLNRLEREMNRTLLAPRRHTAVKIAVSAAVLTALLIGALLLRAPVPDRVRPAPVTEASATPTVSPSASIESMEEAPKIQGAWPTRSLESFDSISLNLADRAYPIRSSPSLDSPVISTLQPGEAWVQIESEQPAFGFVPVRGWDGNSPVYGWLNPNEGAPVDPLPYTLVRLPGKLRVDTRLSYARAKNRMIASYEMSKCELVYVYARMGDWFYVTNEGFNGSTDGAEETIKMGWLPADSLELLEWRDREVLSPKVELLADRVKLREKPGGKVITTMSREYLDSEVTANLLYGNQIVEFEGKLWYWVTYVTIHDCFFGFVSADYARVDTFTLGDELNLDDVISAELCVAPLNSEAEDHRITLPEGDPNVKALCERLKMACPINTISTVNSTDSIMINLIFADGHTETLIVSDDNRMTWLEYNGLVCDFATPSEMGEEWVYGTSYSVEDILSQYFEGYREIIQNR